MGWGDIIWPFDDVINLSPFYNMIFGIVLIFAGIVSFKFLPGFIGKIIAFGMLLAGVVIALGYWVVIT